MAVIEGLFQQVCATVGGAQAGGGEEGVAVVVRGRGVSQVLEHFAEEVIVEEIKK